MSYLSANMSAIQAVLGAGVRLPEDEGRVRVEMAGEVPVLQLVAGGGTSLSLNSRRDPLAEALKVLDTALAGHPEPRTVVAIGLGLGYIIDAIELRFPAAKILALEPEPACIRPLLERRDWTPLISSGRLLALWGPDYRGSGEGWRLVDGSDDGRVTVAHPVLFRLHRDEFAAAARLVQRMKFGARSNTEARKKFAGRYLLNTLRNLPVIARSGDVGSLFGAFPGVPGIIVSAGPSLDRNILELREVGDRAVLIAADTALRPLLTAGIQPHLVVAVDPSETNGRHLRDLSDTGATHLVAEGSIEPAAFHEFQDRVFTFKVSDHHPWPWLRGHGLDRATLRAWGSVATSAFDLAVRLGCDPVVFTGQDLAFTGGQPYCRGTTFEFDWAELIASGATLDEIWRDWLSRQSLTTVTDIHSRTTQTTPTLVAFRDWLVEQSAQQGGRRFINATGAGILMGRGLQQASLEMALQRRTAVDDVRGVIKQARVRRRGGDEAGSVADALVEAMKAGLSATLVETWTDFAVGNVRLHDIHAALHVRSAGEEFDAPGAVVHLSRHGLAAMKQLRGFDPRCALPSSALRRQRVAAVRAASISDPEDSGCETPIDDACPSARESAMDLLYAATEALCRLLSLEELATGLLPGFPGGGLQPSASVSLTAPFDWVPAARADVDLLERLVRIASRQAQAPPVTDDSDRFRWSVPPSTQPRPENASDPTVPVSLDAIRWWARRALVIEWATLLRDLPDGHEVGIPDISRHLAGWLADLADGPFPVALDQSSVVIAGRIHASGGPELSFQFDLCTPPWRLMRGMTGTVVRVPGPAEQVEGESRYGGPSCVVSATLDGSGGPASLSCAIEAAGSAIDVGSDPRVRFLRKRDAMVAPKVLRVPNAFVAGTLDGTAALVTPYLERHSLLIGPRGEVEELPGWPHPIVGEQQVRGGFAVAWANAGSWYLMRRRSADGPVEFAVPPFRPARALVQADGGSFWSATTGGLWRWDPDGRVSCVAPTPPVVGLFSEGSQIRLEPVSTDVMGNRSRQPEAVGWTWEPQTGKVEEVRLGPLGPRWGVSRAAGRWAAAHPSTDVVTVGTPDGVQFSLACDWPVDVAWAGDSLVVVTAHGAVLWFDGLGQLLR